MQGRIKRKAAEQAAHRRPLTDAAALDPVCPLCDRPVPPSQRDAHHLVPRSRGGVATVVMHRICHRQVHALFTEAELERHYPTAEALRAHPEMARFIQWIAAKPAAFTERTRKSTRLRRS